ncbi:MAG: WD40 repeat domain-containing protein, partial [Planctomycetales bacterium]
MACLLVSLLIPGVVAGADDGADEIEQLPGDARVRVGLFGAGAGYITGVYRLAMTADGKLLATRNSDQVVRVWEVESGRKLCELDGHQGRVEDITFSPDGKFLLTCSPGARESIVKWDPRTGEKLAAYPGGARMIQFNAAGDLVRYIDDRVYGSLQVGTGKRQAEGRWSTNQSEWPLALTKDGKRLATTYKRLRLTRQQNVLVRPISRKATTTGNSSSRTILSGLVSSPVCGTFSPDGKHIAVSCSRHGEVSLWNLDRV